MAENQEKTPHDESEKENNNNDLDASAGSDEATKENTAKNAEGPEDVVEQDHLSEWKSKAAYLAAEIENMRKRFVREKSETIKFANESLLRLVFPVLDNLSLAVSSAKKAAQEEDGSKALKGLLEGVEMTLSHFEKTLSEAGVEFIQAEGADFNPELHEAVGQAEDESKKENEVISEIQRGFKLNGRVVRPAKVIVNKK